MKKIILRLGSAAVATAPLVVVISCGKRNHVKKTVDLVSKSPKIDNDGSIKSKTGNHDSELPTHKHSTTMSELQKLNKEQNRINALISISGDVTVLSTHTPITASIKITNDIAETFGIALNSKPEYTYTYISTLNSITITVVASIELQGEKIPAKPILFQPFDMKQIDINEEQSRLNRLRSDSSIVTATSKVIEEGTSLDASTALTFGITLGNVSLADGVSFVYTYKVDMHGITIKVVIPGETFISSPTPLVIPVIFVLSSSQKKAADQALFQSAGGPLNILSHAAGESKGEFDPTNAPDIGKTMGEIPLSLASYLPAPIEGVSRIYTFESFDKTLGILTIGVTSQIIGESKVKGATFRKTPFR